MKKLFLIALVLSVAGILRAGEGTGPLPRSTPEAQGVSSAAVLELVNTLDQIEGMHGLVIVRHGRVIAEGWWKPYDAEHQHVLYSLSKSFTSTAVGLAVKEGRLSIDDLVLKYFPNDAPAEPSDNLKAMRVRDLLMMSTGHQDEPPITPEEISPKSFLAQPVPHLPGTHFKYNTAATFMLSAIIQKTTGQTVLDYLRPRLFEPLGIKHPVWATNFQGISLGGYGLRVRTEDLAKFGQLYLQQGQWQGKQLLSKDWVAMATSRQTSNGSNPDSDWNQGYGYQFWRCRHHAFRGDGAFGQYCVVMPDQDAVVAINSGVQDMQAVLNAIWDKLLPGLKAMPLRPDLEGVGRLEYQLAHLEVVPAKGAATSRQWGQIVDRTFRFPANGDGWESLMLGKGAGEQVVTLKARLAGKDWEIPCGYGEWKNSRAPMQVGKLAPFPDEPVGATFAWGSDDTCTIKICGIETPYQRVLTLKFQGSQVTLDSGFNVAFGSTEGVEVVGRAE